MVANESRETTEEMRSARLWFALALSALVFAGLFALAVVIARMPPFDRFVTDPLFFKRCLVAHVNLALVLFLYAFITALLFLVPRRTQSRSPSHYGAYLGFAGLGMLLLGAAVPSTKPVLANYVPTIDHWLFQWGQIAFGAGVIASLLDLRLFLPDRRPSLENADSIPAAAVVGLRATALSFLLAGVTFVLSYLHQPQGVEVGVYYELLSWGGGHILQLTCVLAMLSTWMILLDSALGESPVSGPTATGLFFALLVPWFFGPLLTLRGTWTSDYRLGFTHLMQWGIFPVTCIFIGFCLSALFRALREGRIAPKAILTDLRLSGFLASCLLTLIGFGIGATIHNSNTIIPAHYHASVGSVTVAFMAMTYLLLDRFQFSIPSAAMRRAAAFQPLLYGTGMALFAAGFAFAGAHGMGRKLYGAEQAARTLSETLGLVTMGIGGLVSIIGGLLFLGIVCTAWWQNTEMCSRRAEKMFTHGWRKA